MIVVCSSDVAKPVQPRQPIRVGEWLATGDLFDAGGWVVVAGTEMGTREACSKRRTSGGCSWPSNTLDKNYHWRERVRLGLS